MSGIEAVGLVLGLWPILKNIVDVYKATKDDSIVKQLGWTLATNEQIFRQSVAKLLQGVEELSDQDRFGLVSGDRNFAATWGDPSFKAKLESRLGIRPFSIITHETEMIFVLLEGLRKKIEPKAGETAGIRDSGISEASGTSRSIVSRRALRNKWETVKLSLQKDEIRKSLVSLDSHIVQLRTLIEPYSSTVYSASRSHPGSGLTQPVSDKTDSRYLNDLYNVLCGSFHCRCGHHEANLRISNSLEVVFPVDAEPQMTSGLQAPLAVPAENQTTSVPTLLDEGGVNTRELFRSTWSRSRKHSLSSTPSGRRALQVFFEESQLHKDPTPIIDLCQWLKKVGDSPLASPLAQHQGSIGSDERMYTINPKTTDTLCAPKVMSMDDYLSSRDGCGLSRRVRLHLAMHLALAIVQFYPTEWIDVSWTWRNFSMLCGDATVQLYITRRFYTHDTQKSANPTSPLSKFWRIIRDKDPLLVRLGFALIELAFGKRLADLGDRADDKADAEEPTEEWKRDLQDWGTANDLVENNMIRDEVSHAYQSIVAACLEGKVLDDTGMKPLRSGTSNFEQLVERFVVGPLREYNSNNWGTTQTNPLSQDTR